MVYLVCMNVIIGIVTLFFSEVRSCAWRVWSSLLPALALFGVLVVLPPVALG